MTLETLEMLFIEDVSFPSFLLPSFRVCCAAKKFKCQSYELYTHLINVVGFYSDNNVAC